ncbi:RING/U-box superfamily protein [Striga hermonthica]|uniref:RBR-type E3 ubiquitin transferase n=1 Tax=Striga hermonthica TaxID=68872 RepID=A0A9N7RD60_STRHE|nr:RING/U-box superfamily protein [Striga hermonthica]
MVEERVLDDSSCIAEPFEVKLEEDEEDFRSCCEDDDELKEEEEEEELVEVGSDDSLDEHSVKLYFKGVSADGPGDSSGSKLSGIGVFMEKSGNDSPIRVQKKLDFYVEALIADYLALLDGLSVAIQNNIRRVVAFTDSQILYDQITLHNAVDSPLLIALRERITEQTSHFEKFILKLIPKPELQKASQLARIAIGIVSSPPEEGGPTTTETCSICCEEKLQPMMLSIKCSHRFCSHCMKTHVEKKLKFAQIPIRCPHLNCKYRVSMNECSSFLPVVTFKSLEKALEEANILGLDKIYCPYTSCSGLIDTNGSENGCSECNVCGGLVCIVCGVRWHSSMTCEEYQSLSEEEREDFLEDLTLRRLATDKRWRQCQQCQRLIKLTHSCYQMTCWCGHEFCYSCGAHYRNGQQTCECAWEYPTQELPPLYTAQELQQFLAGFFSFADHQPDQSPPRCTDSYADAVKDLIQLPWLERFVSLISDNYYEDYFQ